MTAQAQARRQSTGMTALLMLRRYAVWIVFLLIILFFSAFAESFASLQNGFNIIGQSVILLFVSMAMTLIITSGGIDLSVGVSFDFAALASISLLVNDVPWPLAIVGGLAFGTLVGVFNAGMIIKLGISPFLATLGMLFIGESVQRIYTTGGQPIYVGVMEPAYRFLGAGKALEWQDLRLPFSVILAVVLVVLMYILIDRMTHGRRWRALGEQPVAARISGIRVDLYGSAAYIIGAFICAAGGILLSAQLSSYVPISGTAYLLDAIGATFIGAAIDREGRPSVKGTVVGVLLLGVLANGLNLIGINFYWQAVVRGVIIFLALALGALNRRRAS